MKIISFNLSFKTWEGVDTPELRLEMGSLSVVGISKTLSAPMKIIWYSQKRFLRFFIIIDDDVLMEKFVETSIRRLFGTHDEMKLAQSLLTLQ